MVAHLRTPVLNGFSYLLWAYVLTNYEFSCLAILAKPYPVPSPTPLPLIPNQLPCIQISAVEVLGAILEARLQPDFPFEIIYFNGCIVFRLASVYSLQLLLSAGLL